MFEQRKGIFRVKARGPEAFVRDFWTVSAWPWRSATTATAEANITDPMGSADLVQWYAPGVGCNRPALASVQC